MDVRLSAEQKALRDSAAQLVADLGPHSVMQLGDSERAAKLDAAIGAVGWRELRTVGEDGAPLASAVETAIIAQEMACGLADAPFLGPTLAAELRRLAKAPPAASPETVVLAAGLTRLATPPPAQRLRSPSTPRAVAPRSCSSAARGTVASVPLAGAVAQVDLTRSLAGVGTARRGARRSQGHLLSDEDLARWTAFAIAMTCADLVGAMAGAVQLACEYAKLRRQYGAPIGAFQAVQHLLADSFAAAEGSRSVALHAAWAVDALRPGTPAGRRPVPRPTAPAPPAPSARPPSRSTAASATPGSAGPISTCGAPPVERRARRRRREPEAGAGRITWA